MIHYSDVNKKGLTPRIQVVRRSTSAWRSPNVLRFLLCSICDSHRTPSEVDSGDERPINMHFIRMQDAHLFEVHAFKMFQRKRVRRKGGGCPLLVNRICLRTAKTPLRGKTYTRSSHRSA
eukprot:1194370-Prorocentrum_minimum.AAC.2